MTPTDADRAKAHKIAEHLCDFFDTGEHDGTCVEIADALAEQREADAKIAESIDETTDYGVNFEQGQMEMRNEIVAAIRAGGST